MIVPEHMQVCTEVAARGPRSRDRILTVKQPFAWLLVNGFKIFENRSTALTYRGPVWIHSSASAPKTPWSKVAADNMIHPGNAKAAGEDAWSQPGVIVGVCYLSEVYEVIDPDSVPPWATGSIHLAGPFGWSFTGHAKLGETIPYKGGLGLCYFSEMNVPKKKASKK